MENKNGNKGRKSSLDTRIRTEFLSELHLSKLIRSVRSFTTTYTRRGGNKVDVKEFYYFQASITDTDSPYSGLSVDSNTEKDAINKLNDLVFEKAKILDELLYRQTEEKILNKNIKKNTADKNETEEGAEVETSENGQAIA